MAGRWQRLAYDLAPLSVALMGLLWLRPLALEALACALLAIQFGLHIVQPWTHVRFVSAPGIVGLLLVPPLWSLMRLNAALRYLRWGTEQLEAALDDFPGTRPAPLAEGDFLDRQIAATSAAGLRMRDLLRFVRDGIDHMADARWCSIAMPASSLPTRPRCAPLAWRAAAAGRRRRPCASGRSELAHQRRTDGPARCTALARTGTILGEGEDATGRIVLLQCVPFFNAGNEHAGWMAVLVDITPMRLAQHQRDEALRFISHDLRGPSASILTPIKLARTRPDVPGGDALIERHARAGLELADGFVNLARAKAQPFDATALDLVALMQQPIDTAWSAARERRVQVRLACDFDEAPCIADRSLLTRALANVLDNALKYSRPCAGLACAIIARDMHWAISVHHDSPGIAPELQSQLFQPFRRLHGDSHPEVHGIGLGLLLVRAAMQRHDGTIEIDSAAGAGCTITLVLPRPGETELEALKVNEKE